MQRAATGCNRLGQPKKVGGGVEGGRGINEEGTARAHPRVNPVSLSCPSFPCLPAKRKAVRCALGHGLANGIPGDGCNAGKNLGCF
jgi:hypothetical protein